MGLTEGKHCSVCNTVLIAQTNISVKDHDYEAILPEVLCEGKIIKYRCRGCNREYTKTLEKITANIQAMYWSYDEGYGRFVQDAISIGNICGGYGKYTVTISYRDPKNKTHVYTSYSGNSKHYLGDASFKINYRISTSYKPFARVEITDEIGL